MNINFYFYFWQKIGEIHFGKIKRFLNIFGIFCNWTYHIFENIFIFILIRRMYFIHCVNKRQLFHKQFLPCVNFWVVCRFRNRRTFELLIKVEVAFINNVVIFRMRRLFFFFFRMRRLRIPHTVNRKVLVLDEV